MLRQYTFDMILQLSKNQNNETKYQQTACLTMHRNEKNEQPNAAKTAGQRPVSDFNHH